MTSWAAIAATGGGYAREVARRVVTRLHRPCRLYDATEPILQPPDVLLFFSPTYGDAELHDSMEACLRRLAWRERAFGICELGNYYGYDEPEFGSAKIFRAHLLPLGWREVFPTLSLDSLPTPIWEDLDRWIARLNAAAEV